MGHGERVRAEDAEMMRDARQLEKFTAQVAESTFLFIFKK